LFTFTISLYGQLFNQLRDLEGDLKAGVNHSAARMGPRVTFMVMIGLLVIGFALLAVSVWQGSIPLWVIALTVGLALIVFAILFGRARRTGTAVGVPATYNEPAILIATGVMMVWLIVNTVG
jgi:4-hydroxybenzoate polyprenyltransferase